MKELTIDQLQEFLKKAGDYAGRDEALRLAFLEVGQAMGEVLDMLGKQGPEQAEAMAKALTEGLRGLKMAAPEVKMEFKPQFSPEFKPALTVVPAETKTVVQVMPREGGGWMFDFDFTVPGRVSGTCQRIE